MTDRKVPEPKYELADSMNVGRFVPALLTFVTNRLISTASATYRRRFGIGVMDFRVMAMLDAEPGASGARVAEVIGLDKGAVSRTLRSLEHRGLVRVKAGRGRARVLSLTGMGDALYQQAWKVSQEREQRLLSTMSAKERELFRDLLRRALAAMPLVAELEHDRPRKRAK